MCIEERTSSQALSYIRTVFPSLEASFPPLLVYRTSRHYMHWCLFSLPLLFSSPTLATWITAGANISTQAQQQYQSTSQTQDAGKL